MTGNDYELSKVEANIISIVEKDKPETVRQLVKLIQEKYKLPKKEIMEYVLDLQNQGKLGFTEGQFESFTTPRPYFFSSRAYWYWITIALALATTVSVFTVPEDLFPLVYIRYVLGSLFVLFLPGYSFIKAFFPKQLDYIDRLALSSGMSLALVPIAGLVLNYTPFGIRTLTVTMSLLALTVIFATAAVSREYHTRSA